MSVLMQQSRLTILKALSMLLRWSLKSDKICISMALERSIIAGEALLTYSKTKTDQELSLDLRRKLLKEWGLIFLKSDIKLTLWKNARAKAYLLVRQPVQDLRKKCLCWHSLHQQLTQSIFAMTISSMLTLSLMGVHAAALFLAFLSHWPSFQWLIKKAMVLSNLLDTLHTN